MYYGRKLLKGTSFALQMQVWRIFAPRKFMFI